MTNSAPVRPATSSQEATAPGARTSSEPRIETNRARLEAMPALNGPEALRCPSRCSSSRTRERSPGRSTWAISSAATLWQTTATEACSQFPSRREATARPTGRSGVWQAMITSTGRSSAADAPPAERGRSSSYCAA